MKVYKTAANRVQLGDWVKVTTNDIKRQGLRRFSLLNMVGKVVSCQGNNKHFVMFPEFLNSKIRTGWPLDESKLEIVDPEDRSLGTEGDSEWTEKWNRGQIESPSNWQYDSYEGAPQ